MNTVELILHRPKMTQAHPLFLSATSTVERVNLPDGGVALRVDGEVLELLPAVEASGLTPEQHEATAQAALSDVLEAIRLAQECEEVVRFFEMRWVFNDETTAVSATVLAELVYEHWPVNKKMRRLNERLALMKRHLPMPLLSSRYPMPLLIGQCEAIADALGPSIVRDSILEDADEEEEKVSLWELVHPAVLCAAARQQLIRAQELATVIRQHYARTPRSQLPVWARWDLGEIVCSLQRADCALERRIYAITMNVAKWALQELEQLKAQCEEREASSKE